MGLDTYSEPFLGLVLWSGFAVFGLSLLLLALVLGMRLRLFAEESRRRRFLETWRPVLMLYTTDSHGPLPPLDRRFSRRDMLAFLNLWSYYHELVKGDAKDNLNSLARLVGVDREARRMLTSGNLRERLLAITAVGLLREASAWETLVKIASWDVPAASLAAARSLVLIDASRALPLLVPLISDRNEWPTPKVGSLLLEAGKEVITAPLAEGALEAAAERPESAARLVRYLAATRCFQALPAIRQIVDGSVHEELLSECVAAMGEFADPTDLPVVRQFVTHPAWPVRVQAARALGKMGAREDQRRLVAMLDDSEWWVRYRAAQGLASLPFVGLHHLQGIVDSLTDRYARDILNQVIAERILREW